MRLGVVRALGWLVIAHGLSHAVLPLRGSIAPAYMIDDWIPVGLNMIGMIGFVVAGLGMLGLRPLNAVISPVLVLSSGLSLVAISRLGDPTLWVGGLLDVPLLVAGVWRAYAGWPTHPRHERAWHMLPDLDDQTRPAREMLVVWFQRPPSSVVVRSLAEANGMQALVSFQFAGESGAHGAPANSQTGR
jgi:hypothetical protein